MNINPDRNRNRAESALVALFLKPNGEIGIKAGWYDDQYETFLDGDNVTEVVDFFTSKGRHSSTWKLIAVGSVPEYGGWNYLHTPTFVPATHFTTVEDFS